MRAEWGEATDRGDVEALRRMLDEGGDIDARDRYGQTALMRAAHRGHDPVVGLLVERGADLDVTAKFTLSALMLAVIAGHAGVARRLVEAGADLEIRGSGAPGFAGKRAYELAVERPLPELLDILRPRRA